VLQVEPYLFGLPNGNESQSTLQSIFQLAPLDQLTVYTISTNPSDGTVAFDIDYDIDISAVPLIFTINYPSTVMFQSMTAQSLAFLMNSTVAPGRLGAFHSPGEYAVNKALYATATILVCTGYVFFFFGIFSRELASL
jgi:hypothetical protein